MPDFFKGEPLPLSLYPPDTDEKKKIAMEFMGGTANVDKNVERLVEAVKEAKEKYESVKSWGTYGLCWGGKVCRLPLRKANNERHCHQFTAESISQALDSGLGTRHRV